MQVMSFLMARLVNSAAVMRRNHSPIVWGMYISFVLYALNPELVFQTTEKYELSAVKACSCKT